MARPAGSDFVERHDKIDEIDTKVKNKFRWDWLETKDNNGTYLSDYIRKIKLSGVAYCLWCHNNVKYGFSGKQALADHATTAKHKKSMKTQKKHPETASSFQRNTGDRRR